MSRIPVLRLVLASVVIGCSLLAIQTFAKPVASDVTFTGLVTCMRCTDLSQHKGFTRWTWAMYKISQGDEFVFLAGGKTYRLQGDRQQLSKYVEDKVTVSGQLNDDTIAVTTIVRPKKEK